LWFHLEHGTATKGLVHDIAQPLVIRLIHREHAVGKRPHNARHSPPKSGDGAVVLANGEGVGVLQYPIRKRLRRRGPHLADDRESHFDERAGGAQLLDRGRRIAKIVLIGEVMELARKARADYRDGAPLPDAAPPLAPRLSVLCDAWLCSSDETKVEFMNWILDRHEQAAE